MAYRGSLLRVLALSSVGSGLVFSDYATDSRTSVSVSIPAPLLDSLSWSWRTLLEQSTNPTLGLSNESFQHRIVPLFFSVSNNDPSSDVKKESSVGVVDNSNYLPSVSERDGASPKHSCNCLGRDTIANAAAKVGPAVVNISVPKGIAGVVVGVSMGSGTIIDADGTILTCAHVVADSRGLRSWVEGKVNVALQDGRTYEGTVVNADLQSDIAIVKITSKTPLPTANLGSSGKLRPGDWVVALGCPLTLQNTITAGIISCVDRKSTDLGLGGSRREYLQTDCAINEGNSGGPLVNMDGELVGVNIMKVQGAQGLGFSVPVDVVSQIIDHFKTQGRVVRPWLGLKMIELNEMVVAQLKEKNAAFPSVTKGVLVAMVTPGSPADRAGFRHSDVVIEFDGKCVSSIKEITDIMWDRVGQPLKAVVIRGTDESVTLTVIPEEAKPNM
ncbi:OLC1v1000399C1 [Oldenlandia corymbosa var. corymbosa]|uniref:OLC1v1000399C1 n=1 Tax=Oldenlandia corymbosa var. corymbosa TaxID=529605 RepID=A0AAV1D2T6_OLDCO|nr:OLC1v1000399C1 [Oldenlandia corymbosa var. corymbosa]